MRKEEVAMQEAKEGSRARRVSGHVLSALVVLFLAFDGIGKVMHVAPVLEATARLGYPESTVTAIGVLALVGTALYAIPRTALLGAIFLTGFLGGAIATHVRVSDPLASHTLFPLYVAGVMWLGLYLRDPRAARRVARRVSYGPDQP
jgi:xanthine/uracil permease